MGLEQAARQIIVDWDSGIHLYEAITALREALDNSLKPKCFADYQPNHAIDRACASCAIADECRTGEQAEQEPVMVVEVDAMGIPEITWDKFEEYDAGKYELYTAPVSVTTPDVCGEVCARAKLCYGFNKNLEEVNAKYSEQAEQEPVAWALSHLMGLEFGSKYPMQETKEAAEQMARQHMGAVVVTPLYAAPVRTKDLTDDEISDAIHGEGSPLRLHDYAIRDFRAVIAADREKNK